MNLTKSLVATLLLMTTSAAVYAQTDDVSLFYWADTVTVEAQRHLKIPTLNAIATKMLLPLHSMPASIGVVDQGLFNTQNGVTMRDALKNVSGVNVQNGFGTHDFFLIRGFESLSGGLVLTDGAVEPEVSFYNLYNLDRIEVLKGPSSFLYGGNPLSGAVNLVRKQPLFENFANASGSYGDFQSFRGTFDVGATNPEEDLAFRLNGFWQDSEEYRDEMDNNSYAFNPAVTWKIDPNSSLTANFEFVKSEYQPDSGLPLMFVPNASFQLIPQIPNVPRERSYQTPLDFSDQKMFRVRLDYTHELNQSISIRNKFYFTRLSWESTGTLLSGAFPDFTAPGKFDVQRTLSNLDDVQQFFGNQFETLFSFKTGHVKHNLLTGLELARFGDDFDFQIGQVAPIDLFNPVETVTDRSQLFLAPLSVGDGRSIVVAPYFINQTRFSDQVQLFWGGRFDFINYQDDRIDFDFAAQTPVPSATDRTYHRFSPMVGLVVAPTADLSLYANAGQSFRPPPTTIPGDPKAEEGTQIEVGAKVKAFGGRLTSSLAVYHLKKDNIAIIDVTRINRQRGDQRSRGLDFEISTEPFPGLYTFFNYTFVDAELTRFSEIDILAPPDAQGLPVVADRSGNTPAFVPDHLLNFWITKEFHGGLGVGGGLRYLSSQFIDEDNIFKIDDYVTFDATLYYTYKNVRWGLNIKNLGDKNYETRGFNQFSVTPARPRAIFGSVNFSL